MECIAGHTYEHEQGTYFILCTRCGDVRFLESPWTLPKIFAASIDGKFNIFTEFTDGVVIKNHGNHFGKHRLKVDQKTGAITPELSTGVGLYHIKWYINGQLKMCVATCGPNLEGLELTAEAKESGWIYSEGQLIPPLKLIRE